MKELLDYIKKNKWDYELTDDLLWFAYHTDIKHFIDYENLEFAGLLLIAEAIKS